MVKNILLVAVGFVIGSGATYLYLSGNYEDRINEEIEELKAYYEKREEVKKDPEFQEKVSKAKSSLEKPDLSKYTEELNKTKYNALFNHEIDLAEKESPEDDKALEPVVILPEEFGTYRMYDTVSLTYYAGDNVLTTEDDEVINDINMTIGVESLNHFGEYEDDVVYVKNDKFGTYYEVFLDRGFYKDAVGEEDVN